MRNRMALRDYLSETENTGARSESAEEHATDLPSSLHDTVTVFVL